MTSTLPVRPLEIRRIDAQTLAQAYDNHGAAVYGVAHRVTGDNGIAARLTAEVFADLHSVADGADHGLRGCLLTDVHRRAVAWKRANEGATSMDLPLDGLGMLDEDERAVVAEAYFGGKTYDEVARSLRISRAEAARLMQQALHHLGSTTTSSPRLTFGPKTA